METGERAAVLGASADGGTWDRVVVGVIEATYVFARVGLAGFTLGAPGTWRDAMLVNGSASIDANSSVLCSNRTVEACSAGTLPDDVAAQLDRARRFCGWTYCRRAPPTATTNATETAAIELPTGTTLTVMTTTPVETSKGTTATTTSIAAGSPATTTTTGSTTSAVGTATTSGTYWNATISTSVTATAGSLPSQTTGTTSTTTSAPLSESTQRRQQSAVGASAEAATAALGVIAAPLAANKGTTMSRVLASRECRWAEPEPEATQFVFVFDLGGNAAAGALASTLLLQAGAAVTAAACARARRFPHAGVLHLATLSYYGPNVAALATASLSGGEGGVMAAAGLVLNAVLLGVAAASAWALSAHHKALWKDARDPRSVIVRVYGAVDLACAFAVGIVSGAGGLSCDTRGGLICAACLTNFAYTVLMRPAVAPVDNALGATTTLLVFSLAALSAVAPREPRYDSAVLALAAAVTAWMYALLVVELARAIRRFLRRRATATSLTQATK